MFDAHPLRPGALPCLEVAASPGTAGSLSSEEVRTFNVVRHLEIERKFLVPDLEAVRLSGDSAVTGADLIVQGYLAAANGWSLRVRFVNEQPTLTVKGPLDQGARPEHEIPVDSKEAGRRLLWMCGQRTVRKLRYRIPWAGHTWEIDVFRDRNEGIVIAEIELDSIDDEISLPPWCGDEVTSDQRYYNEHLAEHPHSSWALSMNRLAAESPLDALPRCPCSPISADRC